MNKKFARVIAFSVLSLAVLSTNVVAIDSNYCNERYGFCVEYPKNFGIGPAPDNNDGREFSNRDGFKMIASGSNNVVDASLESAINEHLNEFDTVTFRKRGTNWFVLSGYKGNDILYIKEWIGVGSMNSLYFQYPSVSKTEYDVVVRKIVKSFHPGDLSNLH